MKIMNKAKKIIAMRSISAYIKYLKKSGCRIGEGVEIFSNPLNVFIDSTRPFLIQIGDNTKITRNITILTHGFDWSVINGAFGDVLGSSGKVSIGKNCFIGMNVTILKNTQIGDNCIIGAGAVICGGKFPANSVIAGNPAKVISSLEEYYEKRKKQQIEEAVELANEYKAQYNEIAPKELFHEFFWLFEERTDRYKDTQVYDRMMHINNNFANTNKRFYNTLPQFKNYQEFIEYCEKRKKH